MLHKLYFYLSPSVITLYIEVLLDFAKTESRVLFTCNSPKQNPCKTKKLQGAVHIAKSVFRAIKLN